MMVSFFTASSKRSCHHIENEIAVDKGEVVAPSSCVDEDDKPIPLTDAAKQAKPRHNLCCLTDGSAQQKPYQPSAKEFASKNKGRNFQESWYSKFPWLTVCTNCAKAYCHMCRQAVKEGVLSFSKNAEAAFTTMGFDNWKKSLEKF